MTATQETLVITLIWSAFARYPTFRDFKLRIVPRKPMSKAKENLFTWHLFFYRVLGGLMLAAVFILAIQVGSPVLMVEIIATAAVGLLVGGWFWLGVLNVTAKVLNRFIKPRQ